ncbi:hypothetical protein [Anaerotruncus rubiinfantis]|uniref:hypothetical protein n=1 Tax=Anaerotruncus rubiinfantis TaxID=1720200 RepID=UPI00082D6469|nr:hypothetical protein [Anaerotruncus rubiinfantis]
MLDKSDLQAIADLMDAKLKPISERLNSIDERLSNLEEDSKVTRASVNTLLDWAEDAQIEVKIPLYKKAQ